MRQCELRQGVIKGLGEYRFGSFALSIWVPAVVVSDRVTSINCSSVGMSCARTSIFWSVG